jgi:hypothetical protein
MPNRRHASAGPYPRRGGPHPAQAPGRKVSYKTLLYRLVESERESKDIWKTFQLQHKLHFGHTLKKVDEPDKLEKGEFRLDWSCAGEPDSLSRSDFLQDRLHRLVRLVREGTLKQARLDQRFEARFAEQLYGKIGP